MVGEANQIGALALRDFGQPLAACVAAGRLDRDPLVVGDPLDIDLPDMEAAVVRRGQPGGGGGILVGVHPAQAVVEVRHHHFQPGFHQKVEQGGGIDASRDGRDHP